MNRALSKTVVWAGIVLILATGLLHFINAPDSFKDAAYKGILFMLNGIGALVAAVGIYRGARTWGWMLGALIAGGALLAYIASRTIGLPGLPAEPDKWLEPMGLASMIAEVLFLVVALPALTKKEQSLHHEELV